MQNTHPAMVRMHFSQTLPPASHCRYGCKCMEKAYSMSSLKIANIHAYTRNQAPPTTTEDKSTTNSFLLAVIHHHSLSICFGQSLLSWLKFLVKINRLQASSKTAGDQPVCLYSESPCICWFKSFLCVNRLGNLSLYSI